MISENDEPATPATYEASLPVPMELDGSDAEVDGQGNVIPPGRGMLKAYALVNRALRRKKPTGAPASGSALDGTPDASVALEEAGSAPDGAPDVSVALEEAGSAPDGAPDPVAAPDLVGSAREEVPGSDSGIWRKVSPTFFIKYCPQKGRASLIRVIAIPVHKPFFFGFMFDENPGR